MRRGERAEKKREPYRNGQGIVLVDYRNHAHIKELLEGILRVDILRSLDRVSDDKNAGEKQETYIGNVISR